MKTILITSDPILAADAQSTGVSRVMVDLESIGKKERQASRNTFISSHTKEDIAKVRAVLNSSELIVRINPWHEGSAAEVDYAIAAGADIIMLPMITDISQVDAAINSIAGRVQLLPLIETKYSMDRIGDIASIDSIPELYIGLNDLHLSMGNDFLFEPLANGDIDIMAQKIKASGKPFGFGGIAAIGGAGELPAERILGEHVRLGSSCVILSSRFGKDIRIDDAAGRKKRLSAALADLQDNYNKLSKRSLAQQQDDTAQTRAIIHSLAASIRNRNIRKQ